MKLVTFSDADGDHVGVMDAAGIHPLKALSPDFPDEMHAVVAGGAPLVGRISAALGATKAPALALDGLRLRAPFPRPRRNVFCVGKNYHEHAAEFEKSGMDSSSAGQQIPDVPIFFTKATSSVIGPGDTVESQLDPTESVDYEGELTVVIGKGGRAISKANALDHVFGYTIINDVTARTTQHKHRQWFLGKSLDTFCPMGPALVTADEVGAPEDLQLVTRVNGEVRQAASVSDLIFDVPTLIETLSRSITLQPGDLIATGTPVGVAIGFTPPRYLRPGDKVEVEVSRIGILPNPVG